MPLNPLIPLSVQPPPHADPLDAMGKMLQLRSMRASAENNELQAQTNREDYDTRAGVEEMIRSANGDVRKALPGIMQKYPLLGNKLGQDIETHDQEMEERTARMTAAEKQAARLEYTEASDAVRGFTSKPPEQRTWDEYARMYQSLQARKNGLTDPQTGALPLPGQATPGFDRSQPVDQAMIDRLNGVAAYGETEKARFDRLEAEQKAKQAPLQTSDATVKNLSTWEELAGRIGGNVNGPETLAAFRQQMKDAPAEVFAQIPTSYTAPGWARYLNSTRTAQERAMSQQQAAQLGFEREKAFGTGGPAEQSYFNAERPNPLTGDKVDPRLGITPNAVYQGALTWALTGQLLGGSRASTGQAMLQKNAISNKGAAMAAASGVDLPTLRSEYKANQAAYGKLFNAYSFTAASAYTADLSLDYAQQLSPNLPRSGSPIANRFIQWVSGRELTGNPALSQFEVAVYTGVREYAKVTSGASQSVAELSQGAAQKAEQLLNAAQTPQAFDAAVAAMRRDMANVTEGQRHQIAGISSTIANFLASATGDPAATATSGVGAPPAPSVGATGADPVPQAVKQDLASKPPGTYQAGTVVYRKNQDGSIDMFRVGGGR